MVKLLVFGYLAIGVIYAIVHANNFISESEKTRYDDEEFKRICDNSPWIYYLCFTICAMIVIGIESVIWPYLIIHDDIYLNIKYRKK